MRKAAQLTIHAAYAELQILDDKVRQAATQVGRNRAGAVCRLNIPEMCGCAVGKEVLDTLHRRNVMSAAEPVRRLLDAALPNKSCQRMVIAEILRAHADKQRTVGIPTVTGVIAHAVDTQAVRLARRGNHLAARAHAEGVYAASVRRMHG